MVTMNRNKVVIVGTGQVGSTAAFAIVTHGLCNELVLIDHSAGKALGESHDLDDGSEFQDRHVKVRNGDYGDCKDADIVVITVGRKPPANSTRLDELGFTIGLVGDVVDRVMASGFNGVIVMVSNPVDVMAWYAWKRSGLPRTQVLGTGTALDTSRLKTIIGEETGLDPRNVGGFVMGEHGDSQFTAWSTVSLGGKPFTRFLSDNADRFSSVSTHEIEEKTRTRGNEIVAAKGGHELRHRLDGGRHRADHPLGRTPHRAGIDSARRRIRRTRRVPRRADRAACQRRQRDCRAGTCRRRARQAASFRGAGPLLLRRAAVAADRHDSFFPLTGFTEKRHDQP